MSSFFAPFIGLEQTFGSGFTSGSIADAIRVAEQNESSVFDFGVFAVDGINVGNLAFDVFQGLFLVSDPLTGQIIHQGATQQALQDSIERSRLLGLVGPPGPPGLPGPAGVGGAPDFNDLLTKIIGTIGRLRSRQGSAELPGLESVAIGGTVNVPVVPGSTSDPRGTLRPTAAAFVPKPPPPPPREPERPTATQASANVVRVLIDFLLRRRQAEAVRDAQRRQLELLAAAAALRRPTVGFGQSGFVGPVNIGEFGGGLAGGLLGGGIEFLLDRLFPPERGIQPFPPPQTQLPAFPTFPQLPGQQPAFPPAPGIPGLQGGGPLGSACPPLFRDRGSVLSVSPVPWFPMQAPNGKWFFFGHLGKPTFSKLKSPRRHHHHPRKR